MAPLRPLLDARRLVLIAPDGPLNLLPFAALQDEDGRYLLQRYTIAYLAGGRDLLRLQARTLEEVKEPYLIMQGYVKRTPQGRVATANAYRKLGIKPPTASAQSELFGLVFAVPSPQSSPQGGMCLASKTRIISSLGQRPRI